MEYRSTRSRCSELLTVLFFLLFINSSISWAQQPESKFSVSPSGSVTSRPLGNLEDWSSLSLAKSDLTPELPLLGEKYDHPQFTRELLQVKWRQGDPIDLYVIRPKGVPHPPVILYLYSYPSETEVFRGDTYCANVTKGGFAAVGFVSALTGQRYTNRPMKEWFVSELQEALGSSVHDVQMVLNYLSTRGDLDMNRIGMFGVGSGGTIAILAAAADSRIKTIDVIDPWGDWPDWMAKSPLIPEVERPNYLKPEFLKKVAPLDPVVWLPQLTSQHIRLQQVLDDSTTPKVAQQRINESAPRTAQKITYQTTRQFSGAQSGDRLLQWAKAQVQSTSQLRPIVRNSENSSADQQSVELKRVESMHYEKSGDD